ncbi:MAG TPA: ABC transporter permease [Desulfurivibrio alkaliphilus]|uniref:ABC transporter permease n=1 Tax=Desulfurivibrio alkaliphilus TaxID=427923 RepID=A0A7C2XGG3_9BACT|nr:ABC transporter permease [Desulfurivibrio alkaliphilus]
MFFTTPLWATIKKELLLLGRDRAGLLILFVMPAVLVLVITLVQDNVLKKMGESPLELILVDQDGGKAARDFSRLLTQSGQIGLRREERETAGKAAVERGDFQLCIVIRPGMSDEVRRLSRVMVREMVEGNESPPPALPPGRIELYFDPLVMGGYRSSMLASVKMAAMAVQFEELLAALQAELTGLFNQLPPLPPEFELSGHTSWDLTELGERELITVTEPRFAHETGVVVPDSVQQNVPAWSLFGIFFIVVPLAGSIIRERLTGTLGRLLVMPVPFFVFLLGKVAAYGLVCLAQFGLILAIGKLLLPLLGAPVFELGDNYGAILLVLLAAVAAAAAYGILLGTVGRSYEQVSMFGAMSVVIAAALGGVMVPVYAMPETMQKLSQFSPLGWALEAMLEIFVRQGGGREILRPTLLLAAFAAACLAGAWSYFNHRERAGKF